MMPFECYKTYLAMKSHFTKDSYDYVRFNGRCKASLDAFYKRRDRFFFEKMSRQHDNKEIEQFFVANFVSCQNPQSLYMADIIKYGEKNFKDWQKRTQSMSYLFKNEVDSLFSDKNFDEMFVVKGGQHPELIKQYLKNKVSIETLVILDRILGYKSKFDKKMSDPVWEQVSRRMAKYSPFLHIDVFRYKKVLKSVVLEGK